MTTSDWSRFTVRIDVKAPVATLYRAWATRAGIESWFLRVSEYKSRNGSLRDDEEPVELGDTYKWLWHGYGDDTVEYGEILQLNDADLFKFSFGKAGICTVHIKTEEATTLVELVQEEIPTDENSKKEYYVGCKTGWTFYLSNLKSIIEGGLDLRNKNEQLQRMINS